MSEEDETYGYDLGFVFDNIWKKADTLPTPAGGFYTVHGKECVRQSIVHRLMTRKGTITLYPEYGSDLYKLIGEQNNPRTRALSKAYIIGSIMFDPRIDKVNSIDVYSDASNRSIIRLSINVELIPLYTKIIDESHIFIIDTDDYTLNKEFVISIYEVEGTRTNDQSQTITDYAFVKDTDYEQLGDDVSWLDGGEKPDADSQFRVTYYYYEIAEQGDTNLNLVLPFPLE